MTDERFDPKQQDEITSRIVERLAERQYKLQRMQDMKRSANHFAIGGAVTLAVAACITALVVFQPFAKVSPLDRVGIQPPAVTEFRGETRDKEDIARLVKEKNFSLALTKTERLMKDTQLRIQLYHEIPAEYYDEEVQYEEQQDRAQLSELRWMYIYILVSIDRNDDAVHELNRYISQKDFAEHLFEAKNLKDELEKN